jgi:hypothetical protein
MIVRIFPVSYVEQRRIMTRGRGAIFIVPQPRTAAAALQRSRDAFDRAQEEARRPGRFGASVISDNQTVLEGRLTSYYLPAETARDFGLGAAH